MTRVAFPSQLSPSRRTLATIPVGGDEVPVDGDVPGAAFPCAAPGATIVGAVGTLPPGATAPAFANGDIVITHWGSGFAEGVVLACVDGNYVVGCAMGSKISPVTRVDDELEAVVW